MANVSKRETTRGVRYDVRYRTPTGTSRRKTFRTKRDADRFADAVETDKARGQWVDPRAGRIALQEYADAWLAHRPGLRARTRETYATQFRLHVSPSLGAIELARLSPKTVREWHADLVNSERVSANTAAKVYRLLRSILSTAVDDELLIRNPCALRGAGVERVAERPVASVEQVWQLADAIEERYRCVVLVAGFVGLRLGELLGLERRHINLLHGTISVEQQEHQLINGELVVGPPKTIAGVRTLALPPFLTKELEHHLDRFAASSRTARVFPGEKGGPLRRHVLGKHWNLARAQVDLPTGFRFHDLRHTANTLTAAAGASTRELMHRMGHASSEAALRYQHATRERDKVLAQALGDLVTRSATAP